MAIIDSWTHLYPKAFYEKLLKAPLGTQGNLKAIEKNPSVFDLELRLRIMDQIPGYTQLLTPSGEISHYAIEDKSLAMDLSRMLNDELAELVNKHPDRFFGFVAGLALADIEEDIREVDRAIDELGAVGISLPSDVNGIPWEDPYFQPFFEHLNKRSINVWIHPTRFPEHPKYVKYALQNMLGWPFDTSVFASRMVYSGFMERYPGLRIILHHGGAMIPGFVGRMQSFMVTDPELAEALKNLKKPITEYFKMFYVDVASLMDTNALKCVTGFFGADHVLFGTDAPFGPDNCINNIKGTIEATKEILPNESDRQKVFLGNICRLCNK